MNNRRCPKRVPVVKIKPHETQEKTLENKPLKEIQNAPENPLLGVTTSEPLIRTINFECALSCTLSLTAQYSISNA